MTNKIFLDELLTEEQLDRVAGGTFEQLETDRKFFVKLGYDMFTKTVKDLYDAHGVDFTYNTDDNNTYKINYGKHPHLAAMGLVLKKRNYPGFNGNWTDLNYVKSFMKEHFGITNF